MMTATAIAAMPITTKSIGTSSLADSILMEVIESEYPIASFGTEEKRERSPAARAKTAKMETTVI